eukprot:4997618-Prymnesium_polylepis.1
MRVGGGGEGEGQVLAATAAAAHLKFREQRGDEVRLVADGVEQRAQEGERAVCCKLVEAVGRN